MKYRKPKWQTIQSLLIFLCLWVFIVVGGVALAQFGGGYTIKIPSIDGGAATSVGGGYILRGTIG